MSVMKALVPIDFACLVLVPVVLGWAVRRWWKLEPRFEAPKWKSRLALTAFSLGGLSLLLWCAIIIRGLIGKGLGFRYYDLIPYDGLGSLFALVGSVTSLPANGKLRWPAFFISTAMVFIWLFPVLLEI